MFSRHNFNIKYLNRRGKVSASSLSVVDGYELVHLGGRRELKISPGSSLEARITTLSTTSIFHCPLLGMKEEENDNNSEGVTFYIN